MWRYCRVGKDLVVSDDNGPVVDPGAVVALDVLAGTTGIDAAWRSLIFKLLPVADRVVGISDLQDFMELTRYAEARPLSTRTIAIAGFGTLRMREMAGMRTVMLEHSQLHPDRERYDEHSLDRVVDDVLHACADADEGSASGWGGE
jgi:hypothetical protein